MPNSREPTVVHSVALSASLEDYLEAIYQIVREKRVARVKDITERLRVHKSSVSGALRALSERKLVNYAPYEAITLTPAGRRAGREVLRRHEALRDFFVKVLGVEEGLASEAACGMEHALPAQALERLVKFTQFIEVCPRAGAQWVEGFGYFCEMGRDHGDCERCVAGSLNDAKAHQASKSRTPNTPAEGKPSA